MGLTEAQNPLLLENPKWVHPHTPKKHEFIVKLAQISVFFQKQYDPFVTFFQNLSRQREKIVKCTL